MAFMHRCATDRELSSSGVLKGVVGLMGDMGSTFGGRMSALFADPTMIALVQEVSGVEGFQETAQYTLQVRLVCLDSSAQRELRVQRRGGVSRVN